MHRSFAASAILVPLLALVAPFSVQTASAQTRDAAGEQAMLDAINAQRAAQGLDPLARDASLDAAALVHSIEMADRDVLEHVSEQTGTPADRVRAAGLSIAEIAENVAMHHSSEAAQQSLEASEAHVGNMLNPRFTHAGVASVRDERGIYVTQVFGRIEPAASAIAAAPVEVAPEIVAPEIVAPQVVAPEIVAPEIVAPQIAPGPVVIPDGAQVAPHTLSADGSIVAQVPRGAAATVMVPGHDGGRSVAGYWVCANARWYYYPLPPGAGPGAQLPPDLSVTGPPPGYAPGACTPGTSVQASAPPTYAPPAYAPPAYAPPPVYSAPPVYAAPPVYSAPPVYAPRVYGGPVYAPRVYAPPPPPPRGRRYVVVQPRPGTVVAPYVGGPGVSVEFGISPRPYGRVRVRRGRR